MAVRASDGQGAGEQENGSRCYLYLYVCMSGPRWAGIPVLYLHPVRLMSYLCLLSFWCFVSFWWVVVDCGACKQTREKKKK